MGTRLAVHDVRLLMETGYWVQQKIDGYVRLPVLADANPGPREGRVVSERHGQVNYSLFSHRLD
jgi:hypothetical protein